MGEQITQLHKHALSPVAGTSAYPAATGKQDDTLDDATIEVIDHLDRSGLRTAVTASDARRNYAESRKPLLGPLENVGHIERLDTAATGQRPITIFYPQETQDEKLVPGLLYLHGGGWLLGELDTYEPLCRSLANRTGSAIIWLDYRLAPEHPYPAGLEDALTAATWVQANALSLGLDPSRIGIGGDSAGGNLAAITALAARNGDIKFNPAYQLLLYPCLDLTTSLPSHQRYADGYGLTSELYAWYRHNYLGGDNSLLDWRVSPLMATSLADVAPAIILYAGHDILRDEAIVYSERLRRAEVPVLTLNFRDTIHGFLTMAGAIPAARIAIHRIGAAVRKHTRCSDTNSLL